MTILSIQLPRLAGAAVLAASLAFAGPVLAATQTTSTVAGWDTQTRRVLNYHIDVLMDVDPDDATVYREHDIRTLQVSINNGQVELVRTSSIESSNEHFGPYAFHADGSITLLPDDPSLPDDQKQPPFEAVLLMRVFDQVPQVIDRQSWSYQDPETPDLVLDKLEVQQTSLFSHLSTSYVGSSKHYELGLDGELRLFDNIAVSVMVGPPGQRSPEIEQIVANLSAAGNLFLYGSVTFEVESGKTQGQTVAADLLYVPLPFSGGTQASIASSIYRQHLTATLLP